MATAVLTKSLPAKAPIELGVRSQRARERNGAEVSKNSRARIRILIADREQVFRIGLGNIFTAEDDLRVVAQARDEVELVAVAQQFKPGVIFVQSEILGVHATELLLELRRSSAESKIIVTASELDEKETLACMKCGASGVILKSTDPALFVKCARKVTEGELWLPKKQVTQIARLVDESQGGRRPVDSLTGREKMVISYLVQGLRNREIAERLSITEQTVKNHLRSIYDKVGVSDRLELVLYAIHRRLDLPPAA